jgi:Coenzyme PQQ synthesis protein D (PqqD)
LSSFMVASPKVVSEIIDGEAVILDLRRGRYYSIDGLGAQVWRAASDGVPRSEIIASCRASFPDETSVHRDIDALLESLVTADLLVRQDKPAIDDVPLTWPVTYSAPTLQWYDDLADMLALDPVHDVDAVGWPTPSTSHAPSR